MSAALLKEIYDEVRFHSLTHSAKTTATDAAAARHKAGKVEQDQYWLERRIDRLALINMAMWSLIEERLGLTEKDLAQRIVDLDMSDGKLDGMVRREKVECPECGATVCNKFNRCLFCGWENDSLQSPFDV